MSNLRYLLFFVFILFSVTACEKTINGDVFIVTRGGASVKLALTQVYAIPISSVEKEFSKNIINRLELASSEFSSLNIATIEEKTNKLRDEIEKLKPFHKAYIEKLEIYNKRPYSDLVAKKEYNKAVMDFDLSQEVIACNNLARDLNISYQPFRAKRNIASNNLGGEFNSSQKILTELLDSKKYSAGVIKATTDSDGRFSIPLDTNVRYFIVATSSREAFSERYYWVIPTGNSLPDKISLNNSNELSSGVYLSAFNDSEKQLIALFDEYIKTINGLGEGFNYSKCCSNEFSSCYDREAIKLHKDFSEKFKKITVELPQRAKSAT